MHHFHNVSEACCKYCPAFTVFVCNLHHTYTIAVVECLTGISLCCTLQINLDGSPPVERACGIWHPLRTVTVYFIAW